MELTCAASAPSKSSPETLNLEERDKILLDEDYVVLAAKEAVFIECILNDNIEHAEVIEAQERLQAQLSVVDFTFQINENLLSDEDNICTFLGPLYPYCRATLKSITVVEYSISDVASKYYLVKAESSRIDVQLYYLFEHGGSLDENKDIPQAEITYLPNTHFHGIWESLTFDADHKANLIWKMSNMVRSLRKSDKQQHQRDRVILLHGPPGTGKTSLCRAIAQKISIRLSSQFSSTRLIQIKTATLLSKYFSESAKIVDEIFTTLGRLCQNDPDEFNCVLIDEVESLTMSRQKGSQDGESQDTLRATNAFLTGLDRLKCFSNIMFLCTSNMSDHMDAAFLSRCSIRLPIGPPTLSSQYTILRTELLRLIGDNIIHHDGDIPHLSAAIQESYARPDGIGSRLLKIVGLIQEIISKSPDGPENSARFLVQLPEEATELYLRGEECTLQKAYSFMERFLRIGMNEKSDLSYREDNNNIRDGENGEVHREDQKDRVVLQITRSEDSKGTRTIRIFIEGDEEEVRNEMGAYLSGNSKSARTTNLQNMVNSTPATPNMASQGNG